MAEEGDARLLLSRVVPSICRRISDQGSNQVVKYSPGYMLTNGQLRFPEPGGSGRCTGMVGDGGVAGEWRRVGWDAT